MNPSKGFVPRRALDECVYSDLECQTKCDTEFGANFAVEVDFSLETETCTCATDITIKEYIEEIGSVEEVSGTVEIDMQILMDATGSMGSEIDAMSNALIDMLDNIVADVKADTGFDALLRVGVVGYRDPFAGAENEFIPFTTDNAAVDQFLSNLAATGGGDQPEDVNGGLKIMLDQEWTSEHKFIVHVADATALGIPAPDAAGIDHADLFAEINEKHITYIFGKLKSATNPMIAAYNEVYAVNEAGVLVEDASDAEIDILNLEGLSASEMTVTFTTELVTKIVTRVEEKIVTQELGQWAICTTSVPSVSPTTAHPTSLPSIAPTTEEPTNAPSVSTSAPTDPSTSSTSTDLCVSGADCQTKCDAEYGASFAVDVDVSLETDTCTCTTETTIKEYIEEVSSVEEISGTVEIDMQILMDATGSMSASIEAMSNAVIEMLDNIVADVKADTGFDAVLRVGVVGYRDPFVGDESEFIPFTFDNAAVDQFLGNLAAVGGG